jgi:hypothetical protein
MGCQLLLLNAKSLGHFADRANLVRVQGWQWSVPKQNFRRGWNGPRQFLSLSDSGDHQIFASMFRTDELEDACLIAGSIQQAGTYRVGEQFSLSFPKDPVLKSSD